MTDRVVYEIYGTDRRRRVSGVWLTQAHCQAVADTLQGFSDVHASPVNDSATWLTFATGASAGIPGHFTPLGAGLAAALPSMVGVVADPVSAWTTGQYVTLGDTSHAYWNGTAWTVGEAS